MNNHKPEAQLQEPQVKKVTMNDLYPLMSEILESGGSFSLTVTGSSMFPFILGGRDQVTLSPITRPLKKYDLPLYRRRDGMFVLHRIVAVEEDGSFTCCGDHQWALEKGLQQDQMIALATAFVRKGKKITNRNLFYKIYRVIWTSIIPMRPYLFALHNKWRNRKILVFRKKHHENKQ